MSSSKGVGNCQVFYINICCFLYNFSSAYQISPKRNLSEVMTSHQFFKMVTIETQTSGFGFCDNARLRMSKSICIPNFDDISIHGWGILLLPISENGRSQHWNSTFGFDFDLFIIVGMTFCIP